MLLQRMEMVAQGLADAPWAGMILPEGLFERVGICCIALRLL